MIYITAYNSPDLDGIACSIAYSELINKLGKPAKAIYSGDLGLEVEFVKNFTNNFPIEKRAGLFEGDAQFILVDVSNPDDIDPNIKPEKVIEIFDHRELVFTEKFINAQTTIERVGSCATLIIEQFKEHNQTPSQNAAVYLYSAIVSNTTNFKTPDTNQRDIDAAEWVRRLASLPSDYVNQLFAAKSKIDTTNLYFALSQDLKIQTIKDKKIGIAQLEITNIERITTDLKNELENALFKIKIAEQIDLIIFQGVDVIEGNTIFYTIDEESSTIFAKALETQDLRPHAPLKINKIILRKSILPKLDRAMI